MLFTHRSERRQSSLDEHELPGAGLSPQTSSKGLQKSDVHSSSKSHALPLPLFALHAWKSQCSPVEQSVSSSHRFTQTRASKSHLPVSHISSLSHEPPSGRWVAQPALESQ